MYQFIQKHIDLKLAKLCFIMSCLYNLFFNSLVLFNKKSVGISAFSKNIPTIFYLILILFVLLWGFGLHKKLFLVGSLVLFLSGALATYYLFCFNIYPTENVMQNFFSKGLDGIYKELSIKLVAWLIFSGFICIYTIKHIGGSETNLFFSKLLSAFCLVLTINFIISPSYKILTSYFPGKYLHNSYLLLSNKFSK